MTEINKNLKLAIELLTVVVAALALMLGIFNTYQANLKSVDDVRATMYMQDSCNSKPFAIGCVQTFNLGNQNAIVSARIASAENDKENNDLIFNGFQSIDLHASQKETMTMFLAKGKLLPNTTYKLTLLNEKNNHFTEKCLKTDAKGTLFSQKKIRYRIENMDKIVEC